MKKVSVIVLLYNPNLSKILITLKSILNQRNVDYEILISDDGSEKDYFGEIIKLMESHNYQDYKLIKNSRNVGTVKNIIGALKEAIGEYVFLSSPGDLLYDSTTLFDFYEFSRSNNAKIVFGNAVYYNTDNDKINILTSSNSPISAESYKRNNSQLEMYTSFVFGNYILGASYFREREIALEYFTAIQSFAKYVEDTTSSILALADGIKIMHNNRNIVWYEHGTGISTSGNNKWENIIRNEINAAMNSVKKNKPDDAVTDKAIKVMNTNGALNKILVLLNKPVVLWHFLMFKMKSKFRRKNIGYDISKLEELLSVEEYENAGN